eukprot:TRINITY_DN45443_c0_g1_i1.p2 TRINITY_DN45443_c0_g1~~TRINITY_DN45443_c0_g1_i1.p2  ORF type:complete len:106 (+),score=7.28 TRINITY_DN45443_c0_g1_i1:605-922(+)
MRGSVCCLEDQRKDPFIIVQPITLVRLAFQMVPKPSGHQQLGTPREMPNCSKRSRCRPGPVPGRFPEIRGLSRRPERPEQWTSHTKLSAASRMVARSCSRCAGKH